MGMQRMRPWYGSWLAVGFVLVCLSLPGAATASPGDVFVADESAAGGFGAIFRVGPAGGEATAIASGAPFDEPRALDWLGAHTLVVADDDAPAVWSVDSLTGARSVLATGPPLASPSGVDVAADGAIYVTDSGGGNDVLFRIDAKTHAVATVHTGDPFESVRDVALTRQGFAYVSDQSQGAILKVDLANGAVSIVAGDTPLLNGANSLALSPDERTLYVSNRVLAAGALTKLDLTTGAVSKLADVTNPGGSALLDNGSLLLTETVNDLIRKIGPSGSPIDTFSSDPDFEAPWDVVVEPELCGNRFPTVAGTNAPEVLTGTQFKDVIDGRGGADQINGMGAKDVLCGRGGKDRIIGGPGNDQLLGQGGKDKLIAGKGRRDSCNGGKGKDRVRGCEKTRKVP
jgi:DNA-binding beta-propeller fold protein YncE